MTDDPMVAALLRERAGLVQSGLTDRVAVVDEQLRLHGYKPPADDQPAAAKKTAAAPPKGRRQRPTDKT